MKKIVLILSLLVPLLAFSQYSETFSDENLTDSPTWQGTTEKFVIADGWLQLDDSAASGSANKAYLATPSEAIDEAEWILKAKVKANLTTANYVRFYLAVDQANFAESPNGYYVEIGDKQTCSLYKQTGSSTRKKIVAGKEGRISDSSGITEFIIKVLRDKNGVWQLFSKVGEESDFVLEGDTIDNTFLGSKFSGIYVYYSSSNKSNYFFDEISVSGKPHLPEVQNISRHDVVFSEIMADPDPQVELPNAEYIELFNRTDTIVNLAGWKLCVGEREATITEGRIAANDFLLLCSDANRSLFEGNIAKLSTFFALPNGGQIVVLKDINEKVVSWVDYSDKWFGGDNLKKNGGFSLERVDCFNLNADENNWKPSVSSRGGTPCERNSVAEKWEDFLEPKITNVEFVSPSCAKIHFNKELSINTLTNFKNFIADIVSVTNAVPIPPKHHSVELTFDRTISENEIVTIACDNLECISGFPLSGEVRVAIPQPIDSQMVVVNEILFEGKDEGVNFVEIYNRSDRTIDLSQLFITRRKDGFLDPKIALTDKSLLFFPKSFLVLTPSPEVICRNFACSDTTNFLVNALPTLPKEEGNVTLILTDGSAIDEFNYSRKMHHPLVQNSEGVTLERINPELPSNDPKNWHSASAESGFGTPGRQNSQFKSLESGENEQKFWVESEVFSPDNDGNDDLLFVHYRLPKHGFTATIVAYTPSGQRVKRLYNNELLETEGTLVWNGLDNSEKICPIGIYVLVIEAVHADGDVVRQKIPCVLTAR